MYYLNNNINQYRFFDSKLPKGYINIKGKNIMINFVWWNEMVFWDLKGIKNETVGIKIV